MMLSVISITARAELIVVADLGGQSAAGYFEGINNQDMAIDSLPEPSPPSAGAALGLPVSTPEMTPGSVVARTLKLPGMRPLFLVGDDELSRRWLSLRRDALIQLNATGLVINVASVQAFRELQNHAPGLELIPVSGSDLAKRLGLSHYPLLLTEKGLDQ
ncbi:integrating conjugative element protein [Tenebrionicola larvae]|uniref:integrating conjugative element protein n=1 Tax=Tenebrionicola larvae TaxID=2815733 RepID=UPI002010FDA9|nr:integrating conjugative element protein [Tenebrionicola larvae]